MPLGILAESVTEEGGAFVIEGVVTESTLGIVVVIQDCEDADSTMYTSATGVASESYAGGTDVTDVSAFMLTNTQLDTIDNSLTDADYVDYDGEPSSFTANGGLIKYIRDLDSETVAGATVDCAAGYCPAFYQSASGDFSFLNADGGLQTETSESGLVVFPGAPITTYTVTHDTLEFDSRTLGSLSGIALFVTLTAVTP